MRRGFVPVVILVIIALIAVIGGGALLAWRTSVLDPYLPSPVREFFGSETSSESSETTTEDLTEDWKTYTNSELGFSLKYPGDWIVEEGAYQGPGGPVDVIRGPKEDSPSLDIHKDFQGGFEHFSKVETETFSTADGTGVLVTVMYGEDDKNAVTADMLVDTPKTDVTIIYGFNQGIDPSGLEILSLILSTLRLL